MHKHLKLAVKEIDYFKKFRTMLTIIVITMIIMMIEMIKENEECPLQEAECPYSQYGCEDKYQRRSLEHEKEDIHKQMKLTITNIQSEVITLQKENGELRSNEFKSQSRVVKLEKKNEDMSTKIVNLEKKNEEFRSSLQEEKEEMHKHLKLTIDNMQSDMITSQKCIGEYQSRVVKLEEKNEELRTKIVNLEEKDEEFRSSLQEGKEDIRKHLALAGEGNIEWKISGVENKISQKENTSSDPFYVGLYKFQSYVGWVRNDNYVGLFLSILKGE